MVWLSRLITVNQKKIQNQSTVHGLLDLITGMGQNIANNDWFLWCQPGPAKA
jgi:hypothetical protein